MRCPTRRWMYARRTHRSSYLSAQKSSSGPLSHTYPLINTSLLSFSQDIKLLFKRMHHFFYGDKDPGTVKEQVAAAQAAATGSPAPAPLVVDPKKEVILPLETVGSVYKNPIPGEPPVVVK